MELFTNSRATCFRRCQQEHQFAYEDQYRPRVKSRPLSFGKTLHAGIEEWRLAVKEGKGVDESLAVALAGIIATVAGLGPDADFDEFEAVKCDELMRGYHARWWHHDISELTYLAVEPKFEAPMINPETGYPSRTWILAGAIDGIAEIDTRAWNVETKTTSSDISPGSDYWQRLRIDGQVSQYYAGATALGHEIWGCIYDVIKKPTLKPLKATPEENRKFTKGKGCKECGGSAGGKKGVVRGSGKQCEEGDVNGETCFECGGSGWKEAPRLHANMRDRDETPDEYRARLRASILEDPNAYYARGEVVRLEDDLQRYQLDTWRTGKMIRDVQLNGSPSRNPDACVRYGRFCSYWDVCTGVADINDPSRFTKTGKHPELEDKETK
jgi:hypothetical protein